MRGKSLPKFIFVLLHRRAELVKINLLIEMQVSVAALALRRIARVINPRAVRVPRRAAAAGRILNARDGVRQLLARRPSRRNESVPSSLPFSESDTATRFPSRDGTNQSIVVAPFVLSVFGSSTTFSLFRLIGNPADEHRLLRGRLEFKQEQSAGAPGSDGIVW